MAYTHVRKQVLESPEGTFNDTGTTYSSDTITAVDTTVDAYGGATNAVAIAFAATSGAAGAQSVALMATVPCTVTFTGATTLDGVANNVATLAANVLTHIASVTGGAVTGLVVSANTEAAGAAGTIRISVLHKS